MIRNNDEDYTSLLQDLINSAKAQFEKNNNHVGVHTGFWYSPLKSIQNIIEDKFSSKYVDLIEKELFPLCFQIIKSEVDVDMKAQALDCINTTLIEYNSNDTKLELPNTLIPLNYDNQNSLLDPFGGYTGIAYDLKKILYNCLIGENTDDKLYEVFLSLETFNEKERVTLGQSIQYTIQYQIKNNIQISPPCIVIIASLVKDNSRFVRQSIIEGLVLLVQTDWLSFSTQIINKLLIDNEPAIRWLLLQMVKSKGDALGEELSGVIIDTLKNDAHYNIKKRALELSEKKE